MNRRNFYLVFSLMIALLILAPGVCRLFVTIVPRIDYPISVDPIPPLQTQNIQNRKGIKGKVKGIYMDLSHNLNQYNDWYRTGFTLRSELLTLYNIIKMDILNSQPFPDKVIIGRGDWMFTGDRFDESLSEQLGISRMAPDEIDDLADMITGLQHWCERQGICYVFMPTWGKAGFYHDSIPMKRSVEPVTLEQLISALMGRGVRVVNSRPQLAKHRSKALFFRHDSHWNGHGAWIAYQQLMDTLKVYLPDIKVLKEEEVFADTIFPGDMDLTKLIGIKSPDPSIYVTPKKKHAQKVAPRLSIPDPYIYVPPENYEFRYRNHLGRYKALVFRDSYFVHLEPLFVQGFNETVLVWHRIPDTTLIKQENPDVIVHQISERLINDMWEELTQRPDLKIKIRE